MQQDCAETKDSVQHRIKQIRMVSKGNNMFQQKVKADAEAIINLLGFVPKELEELRKEMESCVDYQMVEYVDWDEDLQKYVTKIWRPTIDITIIDDMLDVFYTSIVGRIFSMAEDGLKVLSGITGKPNTPKGIPAMSDLDLYYQEIINKKALSLPSIEVLWPDKSNFHRLRKEITHKGKCHLSESEIKTLIPNIENVLKMLLSIEEQIRTTKL